MLQVWRGEGCLVIYGWVASFKAEKRKVNVGDAWFWVLPITLSLSLSLSLSWSSSLQVSSAFFWSGSAVEKFVFYSVFIFLSDQIFLCFLPWRSKIVRKITFTYFYFLTNFIDISLCTDPMHRSPFFQFEKSLSTDNIWWMLLWTLVGFIIFCVRWIRRNLFWSYNTNKKNKVNIHYGLVLLFFPRVVCEVYLFLDSYMFLFSFTVSRL